MGATDAADSPESRFWALPSATTGPRPGRMGPIGRLDQLREPLPPILIRHGDADPMVADLQAKRLREAWVAADPQAEIDYALVPGAGHGGDAVRDGRGRGDILAFVTGALT